MLKTTRQGANRIEALRNATTTITAYVLSFLAALLALLYLLLFLFEPVASVDAVHLGIARCQLPR